MITPEIILHRVIIGNHDSSGLVIPSYLNDKLVALGLQPTTGSYSGGILTTTTNPERALAIIQDAIKVDNKYTQSICEYIYDLRTKLESTSISKRLNDEVELRTLLLVLVVTAVGIERFYGELMPLFRNRKTLTDLLPLVGEYIYLGKRNELTGNKKQSSSRTVQESC